MTSGVSRMIVLANNGCWFRRTCADYRLNLRKEAAVKLRQDTLTQSMRTMERKVNGLGVAEAAVQQRGGSGGETEIMVQLPGVDDPARVKAILQTSGAAGALRGQGWPVPAREACSASTAVSCR